MHGLPVFLYNCVKLFPPFTGHGCSNRPCISSNPPSDIPLSECKQFPQTSDGLKLYTLGTEQHHPDQDNIAFFPHSARTESVEECFRVKLVTPECNPIGKSLSSSSTADPEHLQLVLSSKTRPIFRDFNSNGQLYVYRLEYLLE